MINLKQSRWLDNSNGSGVAFAYVAGIYHGIGAGLLYATTGTVYFSGRFLFI